MVGMIFPVILSVLWIYLGLTDWVLVAYAWSTEIAYVLGTFMETFNVRHGLVFLLGLLSGLSSMLLFAFELASLLYSYPFVAVGWILFALPFQALLPYKLLRAGRLQG